MSTTISSAVTGGGSGSTCPAASMDMMNRMKIAMMMTRGMVLPREVISLLPIENDRAGTINGIWETSLTIGTR